VLTRAHPGSVIQCFDHYTISLTGPSLGANLAVYDVKYSERLTGGRVAYLRVDDGGRRDDRIYTDAPELAIRMSKRLMDLGATANEYSLVATPATFQAIPFDGRRLGWRITNGEASVIGIWTGARRESWVSGPAGSLASDRDIVTLLVDYDEAELQVDGREMPGQGYDIPRWAALLGRPVRSVNVSFGETSLEPSAGSWWGSAWTD
jgi:hypothetical protein